MQVADKTVRRALINAILERTPTGAGKGQRNVKKSPQRESANARRRSPSKARRRKCCTRSAFRWNGRSVAKTRRTSATTNSAMRSRCASNG